MTEYLIILKQIFSHTFYLGECQFRDLNGRIKGAAVHHIFGIDFGVATQKSK